MPRLADARLDANVAHQRRRHPRAESLGIARVVLARELSLDEIRQIRGQTRLGLEVFVHGALCIAVSGQCMASLALGGRSANRGQCAQACRLPYQLICDGRDAGPRRPEVSAQPAGPGRLRPAAGTAGRGRGRPEDRGAAEVGRVCGRASRGIIARRSTRACAGRPRASSRRSRSPNWKSPSPAASRTAGWKAATTRPWCPAKARPSGASTWAWSAASAAARGGRAGRGRPTRRRRRLRGRPARMTPGRAAASTESFARASSSTSRSPSGLVELTFGRGDIDWINCGPARKCGRPTIRS